MKPEHPVLLAKTASQAEDEAQSAAARSVIPERKSSTAFKPKSRTLESVGLKKKAKRASHRRQIRRSHANG
jgi:hypothetical protein